MERHPWIEAVIDDIKNYPVVLKVLHESAASGDVLVGRVISSDGLSEWAIVPPGRNDMVDWGRSARQFLKQHHPTDCARIGIFGFDHPLILFSVDRSDIPSLKFPERPLSVTAQVRLSKAEQKRQRRAQRNQRVMSS